MKNLMWEYISKQMGMALFFLVENFTNSWQMLSKYCDPPPLLIARQLHGKD
jgi:hypothetical protein